MEGTMNDKKKWLIGIGIVAVLCLCAGAVTVLVFREAGKRMSDAFMTDPASIAQVRHKIAEYDVPPGYSETMAMSLFTYDLIAISSNTASDSSTVIMLMQFSGAATVDPDQMQEAMQQQTGQPGTQMSVVETRTETIRGEQVQVTISETTSQGFTLRQWMTVFRGNGGPAMLMIQGEAETWDDEMVADFIKSIR
jgi:hypothetical protein